jgi:hypothetical protein
MTESELQLDLGEVTMSCTTEEVARTLAALLGEMRAVIPKLREDERDVLRQIMSRDSSALTVADLFPAFARESEGHKTLRRLRAAQFVRPANTGRWDPNEPIEVKPFARLMWDHIGEDALFDGLAAAPAAVPVSTPADDVVDLGVAPEATEPAETAAPAATPGEDVVDLQDVESVQEPAKPVGKKARGADFEDENLDLGDYDDLCAYAEEEIRGK